MLAAATLHTNICTQGGVSEGSEEPNLQGNPVSQGREINFLQSRLIFREKLRYALCRPRWVLVAW